MSIWNNMNSPIASPLPGKSSSMAKAIWFTHCRKITGSSVAAVLESLKVGPWECSVGCRL